MSPSPMSHVEFKKCPCHPVNFRGQGPYSYDSYPYYQLILNYNPIFLCHITKAITLNGHLIHSDTTPKNVSYCSSARDQIVHLKIVITIITMGDFGNAAISIYFFTRWHHQEVLEDIEINRPILQNTAFPAIYYSYLLSSVNLRLANLNVFIHFYFLHRYWIYHENISRKTYFFCHIPFIHHIKGHTW